MSNTLVLNPSSTRNRGGQPAQSRPESVALRDLASLSTTYSFHDVDEAAAKGKSTIWGGTSWELPLIYACDTIPAAIFELWREESQLSEAIAENDLLIPVESCSMIKTVIGMLRHRRPTGRINRILSFGAGCEPMNIVLQMARHEGYDVHSIEGVTAFKPADKRPEVVRFLARELDKVAIWLTGKPADEQRVSEEIRRKNRLSEKVRRVMELRGRNPLYMPSASVLQMMFGYFHYYGNPPLFEGILDALAAEIEQSLPDHNPSAYIPLVLAGVFLGSPELFHVVESSGGAIVGWEIFGERDYREDVPPLEAIAHYLLDAQLEGRFGEAAGAAVHLRKLHLEELLRQTGARGIIAGSVTACPYGSIVPQFERNYFRQHGVPYINLETSVHREPPTEEQVTRLKAFVELLS